MSQIQIVPEDLGVEAAQIISYAVGNFSLNNRLNSSDLENLALEGAKEIGSGLKDVASVVAALNVPLTLLLYIISIGLVVWIVTTLTEKAVLIYQYFWGKRRRRRPCSGLRYWLIGKKSSHRVVEVKPEIGRGIRNNPGDYRMELLTSGIPPPKE